MIDKYAIYDPSEITVAEAVKQIVEHRGQQEASEVRVESSAIHVEGDVMTLRGFKDTYRMSQFATRSLCNILDVPQRLSEALTPSCLSKVIAELLAKKENTKIILRCGRDSDGSYVRSVLISKHGVMDDKVLFEPIGRTGNSAPIDNSAVKVVGFWLSDTAAAMRCVFKDRELDCDGYKVYQGFDVSNSELIPNQSWVKGIIHFVSDKEKFTLIIPKVISSMQSSNKADLYGLLKKFEGLRIDTLGGILTSSMTGLFDVSELFGNILGTLHKQNLLSRKDVYGVYGAAGYSVDADSTFATMLAAARAESDRMTYFDFSRYLLKYADQIDSYTKRSALEFIPNLFVKKVQA